LGYVVPPDTATCIGIIVEEAEKSRPIEQN
jgi:hypothetical protein